MSFESINRMITRSRVINNYITLDVERKLVATIGHFFVESRRNLIANNIVRNRSYKSQYSCYSFNVITHLTVGENEKNKHEKIVM